MTQQATMEFEIDPRVTTILDIVAQETAVDRSFLRPEATIDSLGIASLDLISAVFQLESTFDIEIPVISERPGAEFGSVGELVAHVIAVMDTAAAERLGAAKDRALAPPDNGE
jgi:acyl carrier protein